MIIKELSFDDFSNEFDRFNRSEQFSFCGLSLIYNELCEREFHVMDVIEVCSDYSEMSRIEYEKDYSDCLLLGETYDNNVVIRHC